MCQCATTFLLTTQRLLDEIFDKHTWFVDAIRWPVMKSTAVLCGIGSVATVIGITSELHRKRRLRASRIPVIRG